MRVVWARSVNREEPPISESDYDLQTSVLNALGALLRGYHEQLEAVSKEGWRNDGAPGLYAAEAFSAANYVLLETPRDGAMDHTTAVAAAVCSEVGDGMALLASHTDPFSTGALPTEALLARLIVANDLDERLDLHDDLQAWEEAWRATGSTDEQWIPPLTVGPLARYGVFLDPEDLRAVENPDQPTFEAEQDQVATRLVTWIGVHRSLLEQHDAGADLRAPKRIRVLAVELSWARLALAWGETQGTAANRLLGLFLIRLMVRNLIVATLMGPAVHEADHLTLLPHDHVLDAVDAIGIADWLSARHPQWREGKKQSTQ